eukprot:964886-Pyramimonas_sp.AAC.1
MLRTNSTVAGGPASSTDCLMHAVPWGGARAHRATQASICASCALGGTGLESRDSSGINLASEN